MNLYISKTCLFTISFYSKLESDSIAFLEKKEILLSFHKNAIQSRELLDPIMDELDAEELSYWEADFLNFIPENFVKMKKY